MSKLIILLICLILFSSFMTNLAHDEPIVGVLSLETFGIRKYFDDAGETYKSYISASYVKVLESAGIRVVPVWIGQNDEYYERIVNYTNGLLLPGGATYFNETGGYGAAVKSLYKIVVKHNKNNIYYPIFAICLGMQAMFYAAMNGSDIRTNCYCKKVSLPLQFKDDYMESKMFKQIPVDIVNILKSKNVTYNYHKYCITEKTLKSHRLDEEWKVLSTNKDVDNVTFVSSVESKKYPFYLIQFHPEKNNFEFKPHIGISHTMDAIKATQYFADFFSDECRKNENKFPNISVEQNSLIYNYHPIFTGKTNSSYYETYLFKQDDFINNQLK